MKRCRVPAFFVAAAVLLPFFVTVCASGSKDEFIAADALRDGDEVVIVSCSGNTALCERKKSEWFGIMTLEAVAVVPEENRLTVTDSELVWQAEQTEDGWKFYNDSGETLSCASGLNYSEQHNVWCLAAGEAEGAYYLTCVSKNRVVLWSEEYAEFGTDYVGASDDAEMALRFYVREKPEETSESNLDETVPTESESVPDTSDEPIFDNEQPTMETEETSQTVPTDPETTEDSTSPTEPTPTSPLPSDMETEVPTIPTESDTPPDSMLPSEQTVLPSEATGSSEPTEPVEPRSSDPGPCYWKEFDDCTESWYHEAVDFAVFCGMMDGVGQGCFAPSDTLSRAMTVTVLHRLTGAPGAEGPTGFEDVAEDQWYSAAVAWAKRTGVVNGVTETTFAPSERVTREQIAAILWRWEGKPEASTDISAFPDSAEISGYAANAMAWAVENGLFRGDETGRLNPKNTATRAEYAIILMRFLDGSYACEDE